MSNSKAKRLVALFFAFVMMFTATGCSLDMEFLSCGWDGEVDGEIIWENEKRKAKDEKSTAEANEEITEEITDGENGDDSKTDFEEVVVTNASGEAVTDKSGNKVVERVTKKSNSSSSTTKSQSGGSGTGSTGGNNGSTSATNASVSGDVVIRGGTRGGVITFHTDKKTYDCVVPKYYLNTNDVPALKTLLKLSFTMPEETKKYITTENGYDAIGPVEVSFYGDSYSVSGKTLTFGNKQTIDITVMEWYDIPLGTPSATATSSGISFTIIAKGGDGGKYDCPLSTFKLTADQARSIGLSV